MNTLAMPGVDTYSTDATDSQVALRAPLHDFTTKRVVSGGTARLCWAADVSCASPLIDWTAMGADGIFAAAVPWGFTGYIEVNAEGYLPLVIALDTPLYRNLELYSTGMLTLAAHAALQTATGITFSGTDGLLFVAVTDCSGMYAGGVSVTTSGGGVPFAFSGGAPAPGSSVTTRDGLVAVPRTRQGIVQVNGTVGGQFMDAQAVVVRGGGETFVTLRPVIYDRRQICPDGRDAQTCVVND